MAMVPRIHGTIEGVHIGTDEPSVYNSLAKWECPEFLCWGRESSHFIEELWGKGQKTGRIMKSNILLLARISPSS